jgi:peptide/nickel transport system substrate-binding protein
MTLPSKLWANHMHMTSIEPRDNRARTRVTRRRFIRGLLLTATGLLGVACTAAPTVSGRSSPVDTPIPGTVTAAAERRGTAATPARIALVTPRTGGVLRVGVPGDFGSLEGQTVGNLAQDTVWGVWDQLTTQDVTGKPQPMLAESWEISPDVSQITLRLRKRVRFHTGREMTSDDVKWCLQRLQDPKLGSSLLGRAQTMSGWETPDKYTVVVHANRPWPDAFDLFQYVNIIDPETFQSDGVAKPTGTGPFVFAEYVQGDHVRLTRNPNYWQNGKPFLDEMVISISRDAQAAVVQLESGALDVIDMPPISDTLRLQNDASYQVLINKLTGGFWCVLPNCTRPPTNDKLVRQALNYALDRQRISSSIWHGLAAPEALPWSPLSPAFDAAKNEAYGFDLGKARHLLEQAGVSDLQFDISWPSTVPDHRSVAQIYQADLAKIGVATTLKPLEPAATSASYRDKSYSGLIMGSGLNGHLLPGAMILGPFYGPQTNFSGFTDDAYARLSDKMLAATDSSVQQLLYAQLNDYYLDQSWVLPVSQNPPHLIARANVQGLRYQGRESVPLADLWLADPVHT